MKRASKWFSKEEARRISAAVAEAEKGTSGEIVPVIATASGRYDRAEDLFGLVTALAALAVAWVLFQSAAIPRSDWGGSPHFAFEILGLLVAVMVSFIAGTALASYIPVLRLPFISRKEMREEVERSAHTAFSRYRVRRTAGGTGILVYISLYERRVRVLPDEVIDKRLTPEDWNEVRDLIINGIREQRPSEGLIQAIERCGTLLKEHFPVQPDDRNELSNELRFMD